MDSPKKVKVVDQPGATEQATPEGESNWQRNSFLVFEVTDSPEPDFKLRGRPVAIVNKYRFAPMFVGFGKSKEEPNG